jgi:acetolactate synthase-1/2/3 large subunit
MDGPLSSSFNGADGMVRMLQLNREAHLRLVRQHQPAFLWPDARLDHGMDHILTRDEAQRRLRSRRLCAGDRQGGCGGPSGGGALPAAGPGRGQRVLGAGAGHHLGRLGEAPRGKFPLTELDQQALYKPLTKWNTTIDRVDQIPGALRSAFRP